MSSCSPRLNRARARPSDAVADSLARRRAMLEVVEPLAPLQQERRLFCFLAAAKCCPPRISVKESIEI
jgi:hypothetical protein